MVDGRWSCAEWFVVWTWISLYISAAMPPMSLLIRCNVSLDKDLVGAFSRFSLVLNASSISGQTGKHIAKIPDYCSIPLNTSSLRSSPTTPCSPISLFLPSLVRSPTHATPFMVVLLADDGSGSRSTSRDTVTGRRRMSPMLGIEFDSRMTEGEQGYHRLGRFVRGRPDRGVSDHMS